MVWFYIAVAFGALVADFVAGALYGRRAAAKAKAETEAFIDNIRKHV
jgi:hypothetical protein